MNRFRYVLSWMTYMAAGSVLLQGTCLPDNFWVDKWGEIVNRGIITGITTVLGNIPGLAAFNY